MKNLLLIVFFGISSFLNAQTVPNPSFEDWTFGGFIQYPDGWSTSNEFTAMIGPYSVNPDTSSFEGNTAAKIITTNLGFVGAPFAGFIVNGLMSVTGFDDFDRLITAGTPFLYLPTEMNAMYKFSSFMAIEDWAQAYVILKKWNNQTNVADTIGYGYTTMLNPVSSYTQMTVPITYMQQGVTPDSVVVAFFSTSPFSPVSTGELWVDNVSFSFSTNIEPVPDDVQINIFPNPVSSTLEITGLEPDRTEIFDMTGQLVFSICKKSKMDVSGLPAGLYIVRVQGGADIITRSFVKQ